MAASASISTVLLSPLSPRPTSRALNSRYVYPTPLSRLHRSPLPLRRRLQKVCNPSRLSPVVANIPGVIQTAWTIGKDVTEAGTNLVPEVVPRPIARIGVAIAAVTVALFLLKSFVSTAFFVLAMMGIIYFTFDALNTDEGSRGGTLEEDKRIMEKYK